MVLRLLVAVGAVLYPAIVYVGLRTQHVRGLAVFLGLFLAIRFAQSLRRRDRQAAAVVRVPLIAVGLVIAAAGFFNQGQLFLFVPVLMNLTLLATFARTLRRGPSMVEALARLQHPTLAPGGEEYCRKVTIVWCGFFAANVIIISALALGGSLSAWALYTGLIAYLLIGVIFTIELTYRSWRFRHYDGAPTDVIFRRIFPPRSVT